MCKALRKESEKYLKRLRCRRAVLSLPAVILIGLPRLLPLGGPREPQGIFLFYGNEKGIWFGTELHWSLPWLKGE